MTPFKDLSTTSPLTSTFIHGHEHTPRFLLPKCFETYLEDVYAFFCRVVLNVDLGFLVRLFVTKAGVGGWGGVRFLSAIVI